MDEAAFSPGPRQPKRRGISLAKAIVVGCILTVLVIAVGGYFITLTLADRRLNAELSKLKASGAPLTLLEAAPRQVPPDKNAAVLYDQAFVGLPQGDDEERIGDFISSDEEKREQVPLAAIEEILARKETELRLLEQAAARPACRFPVDWEAGSNALFPHLSTIRAAARLLAAKALVDARRGDRKEALKSIKLSLRMCDHISAEPTLIAQLVRIACQYIALRSLNRVTEIAPLSAPDARRMYDTLRGIDNMGPFTHAMEGERCMGLWVFDAMSRDPTLLQGLLSGSTGGQQQTRRAIYAMLLVPWLPFLKQDQVLYIRHMNRVVELSRHPFMQVKDDYATLEQQPEDMPRYALLSRILAPVFSRATSRRDEAIALIGVAQYGMALRAYQEAVGHYPDSLAQLRAKIDWSLPSDPFSGKDFIYRREGKGYLLYSIGPNMKDEGGKDRRSVTGPLPAGQEPPDDIAWRMTR